MDSNKYPHHHRHQSSFIEHVPAADDFSSVSELFKMLGDETRLRIFWILCHSEECVVNLAAILNMSSPAVAHHLKKLKEERLITSRKDGREVHYKAAITGEAQALHEIIEYIMELTCPKEETGNCAEKISPYDKNERTIREIHDFLISDLSVRYTISELSKEFLINTSTLKEMFKKIYGKPVATYMKEYRMEKAKQLLRETDMSIAAIAKETGYENQGKFTEAFSKYEKILPKDYKRKHAG